MTSSGSLSRQQNDGTKKHFVAGLTAKITSALANCTLDVVRVRFVCE